MITESKIRQHPERTVTDRASEILAKGFVAHVGFCIDGKPHVIPFTYHYDVSSPDCVYLHGSVSSRTLRHLASGAPVCVEVTLLDGLIYSKSAKDHSMNYRSVVCFGTGSEVLDDAKKSKIFERAIERYFPDRKEGLHYMAPSSAHLKQTRLLEVRIEEWSAKARTGGPNGPNDADENAPGTAGIKDVGCL
jgi:nitroimidazol reductase NimA-like FMN-containing flavoprotein (pyridoxamine 5'-phosphate oxidase superfamily)